MSRFIRSLQIFLIAVHVQAVGNSLQGFVNMFIFVIITPQFCQLVKRTGCGENNQDA